MKKFFLLMAILSFMAGFANAQVDRDNYNQIDTEGNIQQLNKKNKTDSLGTDKEIPKGIHVWTVDPKFGDRQEAQLDTISHMFPNTIFTTGLRGEYNTTGNVGAPRIARIFADRQEDQQFVFTQPYEYFVKPVEQFHFTNTLSPFTNLTYNQCGDRTDGEDHLTAKFGVNAGKKLGVGFLFDYIYGRGYYSSQSTSHFNYTMYGSYLGDRYQAHLLMSTYHQKLTENGGITDDNYITHPESYNESYQTSEIPTVFSQTWNRFDSQHIFFSQRYNVGFNRKVKMTEEEIKAKKFAMEAQKDEQARQEKEKAEKDAKKKGKRFDEKAYDEKSKKTTFSGRPDNAKIAGMEPAQEKDKQQERIAVKGKAGRDSIMAAEKKAAEDTMWLKNEYVPVTSFIHTLKFDNDRRIFQAYEVPSDFYVNTYNVGKLEGDSIFDKTSAYRIQNTVALSLLEGFNKWAKSGLKAFITSDLRHFTLPDSLGGTTSYNEHNLSIGGELSKRQGKLLHYDVLAETWLTGEDAGQLKIDGKLDINFPLFGDTVTLAANAFFHRLNPTFYYRHYHSKHFWWDRDDLDKITHTRIQGILSYQKTRTKLRVAVDNIENYTYLAQSYTITDTYARQNDVVEVKQNGSAVNLLTASLSQDVTLGPLNWESVVTYQKSSKEDVIPVPDLNIYTNLYLRFKIARVLKCDFGADARYFTKYYAPDYSPALGQYTVQDGNYKTKVGDCPIVNVYANFHLQHTRFFIMMSNVTASMGSKAYFFTPHYPLNGRILRFGLSWNFFD